jgi:hypothetical protein
MLLLEEGVPSTVRRSAGSDVPELLAAGRRDILVPESGVEAARQVLAESEVGSQPAIQAASGPAPLRLLAWIVVAAAVVAVVMLILLVLK